MRNIAEGTNKDWSNPTVIRKGWALLFLAITTFVLIGSGPVLATGMATGLAGQWTFDDGSGSTAIDSSGNNNNGTLSTGGTSWVTGLIAGALSFDGVAGSVNIPNSTSISVTGPSSFLIWFNTTASPGGGGKNLFYKQNAYYLDFAGSGGNGVSFGIRGNLSSDSIGVALPSSSASNGHANDGQWHQLVGVFTGPAVGSTPNLLIYFDGALVGSKVSTRISIDATTTPLIIAGVNSVFFSGSLDDMRIYNRALSITEIGALYTAGSGLQPGVSPGPQAPAVSLSNPGATVTNTVTLSANVTDNVAITGVNFNLYNSSNALIGAYNATTTSSSSPYTYTYPWDTTKVLNGSYHFTATATNNVIPAMSNTSTSITVTVANPPVISNPLPSGQLPSNTTSMSLSVTSNEPVTCQYALIQNNVVGLMTNFTTTGGTSHQSTVNVQAGNSYSYSVQCQDSSSPPLSSSSTISFSVNSPFTSPSGEGISDEALQPLPTSALWSPAVNFRPGDGEIAKVNPSQFNWSYLPNPSTGNSNYGDIAPKEFIFQVATDPQFTNIIYNITTLTNAYNFLAPLTAGNKYYWKVGYVNPANMNDATTWTTQAGSWGALPTSTSPTCTTTIGPPCWSGVRSFTIDNSAITWDRSMLTDDTAINTAYQNYLGSGKTYLAYHSAHPHLLFNDVPYTNGNGVQSTKRKDLANWLNTNTDPNVIRAWSDPHYGAITAANNTISQSWWTTQPSCIASSGAGCVYGADWAGQIANVAFVWSMTRDIPDPNNPGHFIGDKYLYDASYLTNPNARMVLPRELVSVANYYAGTVSRETFENAFPTGDGDTIFTWLKNHSYLDFDGHVNVDLTSQTVLNALQSQFTDPGEYQTILSILQQAYADRYGPETDTIEESQYSTILRAISLSYDWLYNELDAGATCNSSMSYFSITDPNYASEIANFDATCPQHATVLNPLNMRAAYLVKGWGWFFESATPPFTWGGGDPSGKYPGGSYVRAGSSFKEGTSHGIDNFDISMLAAIGGYGDSPELRQLFDLGLNYMIGVTFPYGTDGSTSEGRAYSGGSLYYFDGGNALYNAMAAQTSFPEANFNHNPYWQAASNFWNAWTPVDYFAGHEAWGDTSIGEFTDWSSIYVGRDMAYFLNDPVAYEHWVNEDAHVQSENHNGSLAGEPYYELPTAFNFPQPSSQDSTLLNQFYPQGGWALGCSQPQNSVDSQNKGNCFDNGVGYVFAARPKGGYGGHDHYYDMSFQLWAYGTTITDQSGQYNTDYAFSPIAQNSLLVNGVGPVQPEGVINGSYYSRIFGYKTTPDYTYFVADGTNAYPTQNLALQLGDTSNSVFAPVYSGGPLGPVGLKKVQRHFLFVHNKYFVVYDDFASTMPANYTFLYHVLENTLTPDFTNGEFSYTSNVYQYLKSQDTRITLQAGGLGYTVGDVLNITQPGGGSGATATVSSVDSSGAITAISLTTDGTGYTYTPLTGGSGSGATCMLTISPVGVVTAVSIVNEGTGYSVGNILAISGGSGGTVTVSRVSSTGAIVTTTLTTGGSGYSYIPLTGGTGSGATVTITTPSLSNFPLTFSDVPVYVKQIEDPSEITITDLTGIHARSNPILASSSTPENYGWGNESMPRAHALWVTNKSKQTNFHFMTVIYPVKPGNQSPTITRIDDNTARITANDGTNTDDIISFDPSTAATNHATIVIDLPHMKPLAVPAGGYTQTQTFAFNISHQGSGSGTVAGTNINCNSACLNTNNIVAQGSLVTLTATPANGSVFTGWSGDCTGIGVCNVTVNSATSVMANFSLASAGVSPIITSQPISLTVTARPTALAMATFTVAAMGVPSPSYQWEKSTDNGNTWVSISGATTATYLTMQTTLADNGTEYQCVVSNTVGSVTSDAVTLTVNPAYGSPVINVNHNRVITLGH